MARMVREFEPTLWGSQVYCPRNPGCTLAARGFYHHKACISYLAGSVLFCQNAFFTLSDFIYQEEQD